MKRIILSIVAVVCVNIGLSQERFTIGDLTYEVIDSNRVEVDRCSISATAVVIPDSVQLDGKTYTVSRIGTEAFKDCSRLDSVIIPSSVATIGMHSFLCCRRLKSVVISYGVKTIGYGAFSGCISLTAIDIPVSVDSVGASAFYGCNSLEAVVVPNGVRSHEWALMLYIWIYPMK